MGKVRVVVVSGSQLGDGAEKWSTSHAAGRASRRSVLVVCRFFQRFPRVLVSPALVAFVFVLLLSARPLAAWQPDPSQAQNMEFYSQQGGSCHAVAVAGGGLVIGEGPRVVTVDLADPARPVERASVLLPAMISDIAVTRDMACVLANGLWVIDLRQPDSLRDLSYLPLSGNRLFTSGTLVYVLGRFPSLQIVDLRHPDQPNFLAQLEISQSRQATELTGMVMKEHYALVSYIRYGLSPGTPTVGGFALIDVSNPKAPWLVYDYPLGTPVYGIALDHDSLYLVANGLVGLFEVQDPLAPQQVGWVAGPLSPRRVSLANGRAIMLGFASQIWAFALEGINLPHEILHTTTRGDPVDLKAAGNRAFVADGEAGLTVWDFATSAALTEIGNLSAISAANDIALWGDYAYLADGQAGVRVFSLSDPDHPAEVARFQTAAPATGLSINGLQLYIAEQTSGLEILDIRQPVRPVRLAFLPLSGQVEGVTVRGNYAYVAGGTEGLMVVRISDPAHPAVIGRSQAPGYAEAVTATADRVFVCDQTGGIVEINVSNPASPTATGRLGSDGTALQAVADGQRLAVAESDHGLRVVDIGLPGHPRTLGQLEMIGGFQGLAFQDGLAYVADAQFGLRVINAVDPRHLSLAGFYATAGRPRRVAVAHHRIYLAAGNAGFYVLRYSGAPDLAIRDFDFDPQEVVAGTELHLRGRIVNYATTPTATAAWAKVYVSETPDFAEPRWLFCPPIRLPAGMTNLTPYDLAAHRFIVFVGFPKRKFYLGIIVDTDNEVAEFSKNNNMEWITRKPIFVGPRPLRAKSWTLYR